MVKTDSCQIPSEEKNPIQLRENISCTRMTSEDKITFLKKAIVSSIVTIEETRKSFKSKKLESLRMDLIRVLASVS